MMDLSIIIVNYNTKDLIRHCISSIIQCTRGITYEIIVVDNDSTDGSEIVVNEEFPTARFIRNSRNLGFAAGNNVGITNASGEFILFLNSDAIVTENILEDAVKYLKNRPDIGILGCKILNPDGSVQPSARDFPNLQSLFLEALAISKVLPHAGWLRNPWITDDMMEQDVDIVKGAFLLTRRATIGDVGIMDERFFLYSEEQDFCYRVKKKWRIVYWPLGTIYHHEGGSSSVNKNSARFMLFDSEIAYFTKHYGRLYATLARGEMLVAVMLRLGIWSVIVWVQRLTMRSRPMHIEKMKYYWYAFVKLCSLKTKISLVE